MDVNITVPAAANDVMSYLPLYKVMVARDWEKAKQYVGNVAGATAVITVTYDTVLHVAIGLGAPMDFVKNLVALTPGEAMVGHKNSDGDTVLSVAAAVGNVDAARLLVERNRGLLFVANKKGRLPIHMAALRGDEKIVKYLLSVVEENADEWSYCLSGDYGFRLSLFFLLHGKFYDLVLKQVESYPELATMTIEGQSLLGVIASAIPSTSTSRQLTWELLLEVVFQKSKIRHASLILTKLIKCLCEKATELELSATVEILQKPLFQAAQLGNTEVVEGIVAAFPPAIWFTDTQKRNVLHLAVENRRGSVLNLISRMYECKQLIMANVSGHGDNILHLAARLPPVDILESTPSPFLQMRQEMEWFKVVEKLVPPSYKLAKNGEEKTPRMVLRETHRNLVAEGQKWVKDVANACSVVAALIASIAFTSMITNPRNTGNHGTAIRDKQPNFVIFAITNGLSFMLSTYALLASIEIQIFGCTDEAFVQELPTKLSRLLVLLTYSVFSTVLAFCVGYYVSAVEGSQSLTLLIEFAALVVLVLHRNLPLSILRYDHRSAVFKKLIGAR